MKKSWNLELGPRNFRDRKVTVMGLGLNQGGLGVSKWLLKHGAKLLITDLKDELALAPSMSELEREFIRLSHRLGKRNVHRPQFVLGRHRMEDFRNADVVIQNPGVPRGSKFIEAALKAGASVETDMSIFFRLCPFEIAGISGTRGKTTTTAMLGAMLKRRFGRVLVAGNIRKSPLDALDGLLASRRDVPIALELSSWHLEGLGDAHLSPQLAVLTNVMPDHLNRYKDMADYASAKELIYANQTIDDVAIVPFENAYTRKMAPRVPSKRIWASKKLMRGDKHSLGFRGARAILRVDGQETELFRTSDVRIPGEHNLWNALLAAGAASLRGVTSSQIRAALRAFKGVPYRLESLGEKKGVVYWNDTAATSPDGSIAAMKTLGMKKKLILIAGGADKNLDFKEWAKQVKKSCKAIILFEGAATLKMLPLLKKQGIAPLAVVKTMTSAVLHASHAAKKGDTVVLSPGAASFGLFINEFDRGDQFRAAVRRLH